MRSLAEAFPDGGFPPIVAVELGDAYFVIDGHHRAALARRHGSELIDADWYDNVYAPAVRSVDRAQLGKDYRDAPDADLFLMLHRHRRDAFPSCGCPPLEQTFATVAADEAAKRRGGAFRRR